MISTGVPAGASTPFHEVRSNPGTPASAMVGVSASAAERLRPDTASARICPALTCGIDAGRLRAAGVTGPRRLAALPDVSTISESGLPGYESVGWHGWLAPAETPREIINQLNASIRKVLALPEIKSLWNAQGVEVVDTTPEQFAARMRQDYDNYGKLIKSLGLGIKQ